MSKKNLSAALSEKANGNGEKPATGGIKSFLNSPAVKKRFEEVLDKRAPQFISSVVNLVNSDKNLMQADPMSVISSCMVAATLDLPVDKNLGYAWIVPYRNRSGVQIAQFQMGYKGYIQLALRTGKYKAINAVPIHEGELIKWNPLTEELEIDFEERKSDAIIGYAGYFELVNGFRKAVYWTKDQIEAHRKKFSKSDFGWKNDYDAMALKTVLRNMLSKWGILSIEMQDAYVKDIDTRVENAGDDDSFIDAQYEVLDDEDEDETEESEQVDEEQSTIEFEES